MAQQLRHLAEIALRPNVSLRVVPWDIDDHPGTAVPSFTLLEFGRLESRNLPEPPVVYIETHAGALFLEDDSAILHHRKAITEIERVALSDSDTKDLVLRIAEECVT